MAYPSEGRTIRRSFHIPVLFLATTCAVLYQLEPVHHPTHELGGHVFMVKARNEHARRGSELVGVGQVAGPEDLVYDVKLGIMYSSCENGWIKQVTVNESVADSVVQNWVNTGGRPLGLALRQNGELIVADALKGLLRVTREEKIEALTEEAEGLKFKITNGVAVADEKDDVDNGNVYFTDASYKYNQFIFDILEGNPHGRLMSFNLATRNTTVLATNLYFPNGVALSPDNNYIVFCETIMRRCRKYYIEGLKKGRMENFVENLPGMPDNIHYDGQGHYWIALTTSFGLYWDIVLKYPFIRKAMAIMVKYIGRPHMEKNGGVIAVDLEGRTTSHYYDYHLSFITSGIKIHNYLYLGSLQYPYILRLDLDQHPALPMKT